MVADFLVWLKKEETIEGMRIRYIFERQINLLLLSSFDSEMLCLSFLFYFLFFYFIFLTKESYSVKNMNLNLIGLPFSIHEPNSLI